MVGHIEMTHPPRTMGPGSGVESPRRVIQADRLVLPDGLRGPGYVTLEDGRVAGVEEGRHRRPDLDGAGCVLAPGFVDLQVNGAAGCDFLAPTDAGLEAAHAHLRGTGTTGYLATLISAPEAPLRAALAFFAARMHRRHAPAILGVHLEGPFLSPARAGAHRLEHLRPPSVEWITRLLDDFPGVVRLVTLAPECEGADAVIDALVSRGIVVSAGHTDATYEQAMAAFDRGVRMATHLFNAMRPYHHREPGIIGAALAHPRVTCSVIADHVHVHPAVLDQALALTAPERAILVTDAISAAGAQGTALSLGDRTVRVVDGAPRLDDGILAGSVLTMDQAVRNVSKRWGVAHAVRMAATIPARLLGLHTGVMVEGAPADLVLLDERLAVRTVIAAGDVVWTSQI
ncbi:MAG: N-acetylglucosamine-6-phosphate deacetylase [Armatimonadota bacterium]|nr:N-acetylglucosamine-6-phosphate deacetylase [Armatimonadota bacterium]